MSILGAIGLFAVVTHGQKQKPRIIFDPPSYYKAGAFIELGESDRQVYVAGLMDGSVSTLAPVFAAAFATRNSWDAFLVGIAASVGAGISMGFAEALSDDGVLSGRGQPLLRGTICGLMTTLGGIGHTLPFLIPNFYIATWVAVVVVAIELAVIAWIRNHYMDTPLVSAIFQVVLGGVLVFLAGWWHVHRELTWVRALTDYVGEALVADPDAGDTRSSRSLEIQQIRDEAHAIAKATDPAWAQKQVRSWQMRAQRLEPALGFWTDLLRQLGLLGTVLGLGLSLAYTGSDLTKLLGPLALKVWTTVAGLACSILLSASFSMRLTAWVDACEKNLEAWDARRRARRDPA